MTTSATVAALFLAPNVADSLIEHIDKIAPAIRALETPKFTSAAQLLDDLQATSISNFMLCFAQSELAKGYVEA